MKKAVLCINRDALTKQDIPANSYAIYPFNVNATTEEDFHFINRTVADGKTEEYLAIAKALPQILGYCVITDDEMVLSYSRKKAGDTRLSSYLSIGFGGHVDIDDAFIEAFTGSTNIYHDAIINSIYRELKEELGVDVNANGITAGKLHIDLLSNIIVDQTNQVGEVHVGLPLMVNIPAELIKADESEIVDLKWVSLEQLKADYDLYENWSKLLIDVIT